VPEYLLRLRRFDPASGEAAYWDEHFVDLGETNSVLDAILKVRDDVDGSVGIRCSCQQAICGSCGVRMNGKPGLACNTHLGEAAARVHGTGWNPAEAQGTVNGGSGRGDTAPAGVIEVEPMGNMPVIRDLIVDMDAVHWKKIQRVTPYLINQEPVPEREYIVPHENMVDVTQTMACIQCGACVSDCLSMEIDPLFVGPAASAKAYRFVGDPRDAQHQVRLNDLAQDPHGIFDCTHCFNCIDACPKGVDPMSQIMRLRRKAGSDHHIVDANNGHRHEDAFVTLVREYGLLNEAEVLPRSYGGNSWFAKFHPAAGKELMSSLGTVLKGVVRGKITPKVAMFGHKLPKRDLDALDRIYSKVEGRSERVELNLYVSGYEDEADGDTSGAQERQPPAEASAATSGKAGEAERSSDASDASGEAGAQGAGGGSGGAPQPPIAGGSPEWDLIALAEMAAPADDSGHGAGSEEPSVPAGEPEAPVGPATTPGSPVQPGSDSGALPGSPASSQGSGSGGSGEDPSQNVSSESEKS
jgi:succinate dehydrogenase / fumarate reductase iron-sulfur subunit